jgi:hypothetical protein
MTRYLAPTPTENWDEQMRTNLLAALRQDGIDPGALTDRQVVTQVSRWLKRRSKFTDAFAIWYVHYPGGQPEVFPLLRAAFDRQKKAAGAATDQDMFDQERLGRSMFYGRVHGSCVGDPTNPDFYIGIEEYIPHYASHMRDFEAQAGHHFVWTASGHPDLKATLSGIKLSNSAQYQIWGVRIDPDSRKDLADGTEYGIRPVNTSEV